MNISKKNNNHSYLKLTKVFGTYVHSYTKTISSPNHTNPKNQTNHTLICPLFFPFSVVFLPFVAFHWPGFSRFGTWEKKVPYISLISAISPFRSSNL